MFMHCFILFALFCVTSFAGCSKKSPSTPYTIFQQERPTLPQKVKKQKKEKIVASKQEEPSTAKPDDITKKTKQSHQKTKRSLKKQRNRPIKEKTLSKPHFTKSKSTQHVEELDFEVENATGKTIYVTCFAYLKREDFTRWHWDKSPIFKIDSYKSAIIDVTTIKDSLDRHGVYGYLGVFDTIEEALASTYELLPDIKKIDLDLLYKLKNKKVVIEVKRYGFKGISLSPSIEEKVKKETYVPELDFLIENQTGKNLYITCFLYQDKGELSTWSFVKSPVVFLRAGHTTFIDIQTTVAPYERSFLRGFLGVFDENQKELADNITYELLKPENKLRLGILKALAGHKVILVAEQYGIAGDMIDYTIKSLNHITFGISSKEEGSSKYNVWR